MEVPLCTPGSNRRVWPDATVRPLASGGANPFDPHPAPLADGRSLAWIWRGGQERKRKNTVSGGDFVVLACLAGSPGLRSRVGQHSEVPEGIRLLGHLALPDHYGHRGPLLGDSVDNANPASTSDGHMLPLAY